MIPIRPQLLTFFLTSVVLLLLIFQLTSDEKRVEVAQRVELVASLLRLEEQSSRPFTSDDRDIYNVRYFLGIRYADFIKDVELRVRGAESFRASHGQLIARARVAIIQLRLSDFLSCRVGFETITVNLRTDWRSWTDIDRLPAEKIATVLIFNAVDCADKSSVGPIGMLIDFPNEKDDLIVLEGKFLSGYAEDVALSGYADSKARRIYTPAAFVPDYSQIAYDNLESPVIIPARDLQVAIVDFVSRSTGKRYLPSEVDEAMKSLIDQGFRDTNFVGLSAQARYAMWFAPIILLGIIWTLSRKLKAAAFLPGTELFDLWICRDVMDTKGLVVAFLYAISIALLPAVTIAVVMISYNAIDDLASVFRYAVAVYNSDRFEQIFARLELDDVRYEALIVLPMCLVLLLSLLSAQRMFSLSLKIRRRLLNAQILSTHLGHQ